MHVMIRCGHFVVVFLDIAYITSISRGIFIT